MQRLIHTTYRDQQKKLIRTNRATYPDKAVLRCVGHMQTNQYGAAVAEVFNDETGEVFAQVVRLVGKRRIEIVYRTTDGLGVDI